MLKWLQALSVYHFVWMSVPMMLFMHPYNADVWLQAQNSLARLATLWPSALKEEKMRHEAVGFTKYETFSLAYSSAINSFLCPLSFRAKLLWETVHNPNIQNKNSKLNSNDLKALFLY